MGANNKVKVFNLFEWVLFGLGRLIGENKVTFKLNHKMEIWGMAFGETYKSNSFEEFISHVTLVCWIFFIVGGANSSGGFVRTKSFVGDIFHVGERPNLKDFLVVSYRNHSCAYWWRFMY